MERRGRSYVTQKEREEEEEKTGEERQQIETEAERCGGGVHPNVRTVKSFFL